ncbi:MAG: hypothetical protein AAGB93_14695 [Planctomycetota bacterium]
MTLFTLSHETLDAPMEGSASLADAATFRRALGPRATIVAFVRHFG